MSARLVVIDVETRPTTHPGLRAALVQEAAHGAPPASASKVERAEWHMEASRERRMAAAIERTMVDPLLAELLVVSFSADGAEGTWLIEGAEQEHDVMAFVSEALGRFLGPETVLAGHNIKGFDLPVLLNRWRFHAVRPPAWFPRYSRGCWAGGCLLYDTMEQAPGKTPFVKMDKLCQAYGLPSGKSLLWRGEPMNGGRVLEAYEAGEFGLLTAYCQADVRAEEALFNRMTFNGEFLHWERDDNALAYAVGEIEAIEGLSATQRDLAILNVLRNHGRVPKGRVRNHG